ncbi:JIP5 [Candida pseudojiufengensis]|uniref:JIP5 n=1 Tax=Candida pseudojiufengensis TaxID=497109 RepID=UPI0022246D7C|nr:JIP5 [Candida pseudojiufengensis]KAI5963784.1 JIP5 [Candida pseudojiufengensis]
MVKKKSKETKESLESSIAPLLEINYKEPLFTAAAHPTKPILISGLATGHLYCNTYDPTILEAESEKKKEEIAELEEKVYASGLTPVVSKSISETKKKWWKIVEDNSELPTDSLDIKTNWKTKRHKGSCRHAIFDPRPDHLGEYIYTCGTDNVIKKANTESGKVVGKVDVVEDYYDSKDKLTKLCHSNTHSFILSGTEDGNVLVYDSSNLSANNLKFKVQSAHDDSINHILSMTSSPYHYLTLGSTTLSHIDIRKGIITQSDDQEDELLSMSYTTEEISDGKSDTVLVSHGEGLITIWKNSKNKLRDQLSRIKLNKDVSIDSIIPTMNNSDEDMENSVWCGDSDGMLHRVNFKKGKVVETRVHSKDGDEVGILDIDYDYRLISAGMDTLKIWGK